MAHREQHGNRETKKPKKGKGGATMQPSNWTVSKVVESNGGSKH